MAVVLPSLTRRTFCILLVCLLLLGWGLQMDGQVRTNTVVKFIDLIMNLVMIIWASWELVGGGPKSLVWAFLLYRSFFNILPLCKMMISNYTNPTSTELVQQVCLESRRDYTIEWERKFDKPCIYIANHALGCLDDIVALGALSRKRLSVVINTGPSGLRGIPNDCRDYMCVINRKEGVRGSGYQTMKEIIHSEILGKGKSLIVFAEDMKKKESVNKPAPLRSGTIALARQLNIPVVPLWIEWPCLFPTLLNPCSKLLVVKEGTPIQRPEGDLKTMVYQRLLKLSAI